MSPPALTTCLILALLVIAVLCIRMIRLQQEGREQQAAMRLEKEKENLRDEARRNEMLESILQGLGDACLIVDLSLQVIFANEEVRHLFRTQFNPVGKKLFEVIPDHRLLELIERCRNERRSVEQAYAINVNPGGDNIEKHIILNAALIRIPGPRDRECLRVILRDETEHHETEQIRKDFVANASHELRTPLSIINGYLENLIEGVIEDPAMMQKSLVTMQKHGTRLARIVEDMLTISRFESAGQHEGAALRSSHFECAECAQDVLDRLAPVIEEKAASIVLEFPPEGSTMAGDRFYWDQVFFNLIENALKENSRAGLVIKVGMKRSPAGIELWIEDNGVGIPRSDLPFIFKRFYRVAKHHSQQDIKGTGLGLSIVRRAIEAHGGTIFADSVPGSKTVFTISLPAEVIPAAA